MASLGNNPSKRKRPEDSPDDSSKSVDVCRHCSKKCTKKIDMRKVTITLLMFILAHSTSGQQYPNCGNCQRDDVVIISQPPLSYTTMRSDGYFGTQPSNDGCTPNNGQETINCGVETTLMDCERGPSRNLNISDLSDYFVWNRTSSAARNVSVVFRFDQPVNIRRISMFFWYAPINAITLPNLTLYSSNDNSTTPSNQISIDTSDSPVPVENRQYRLKVDITNEGLIVKSLRIMMTISDWTYIFLSEVMFCVAPDTTVTTTNTVTITAISSTAATTTSTVSTLKTYLTTTGTAVSTILSSLVPPSFSAPTSSLGSTSNSNSSSSNIGLIVGVILAAIIITIIITVVVVVVVVWKEKRSVSTKPEGVYYSTIDEGTLQTSLPNKPEPIYTEMSDEKNRAKNISNTRPTQQHVTMQDNPAYTDPKEQVVLQDNPAYSDIVNNQVNLQDNPAYGSTSIDIKN